MATEMLPSVCPHDCPGTCALTVERLAANRIGRIHGSARNPLTNGIVCAKVARYAERVHGPARLLAPLIRSGPKGSGLFRPASRDEALDRLADGLRSAIAAHGPETVWPYFYGGTMGLVQRGATNRLRHVLGASGQGTTICAAIGGAGWLAGVGGKIGTDPREMADSELIVFWGMNPVATQINTWSLASAARKARGARIVVIDPYRTASAEAADLHLMPRPGTDAALACAIMHVLFRDSLDDAGYMARYTDEPAALARHVAGRSPTWAEAITGIPTADIEAFARLYGTTRASFLRFGYGMTRQRNGAFNLHAASCLPAVTGAWRHRGGGALFSSSGTFHLDMTLIEATERRNPAVRSLDMSRIGPILAGAPDALVGGNSAGPAVPVTAMLVQSANPALTAPESTLVRRGLAREDLFLCVHDQVMTDTARFADVILPATTFLEHDDIYTAYGHTFLQAARAVIPPQGEALSNHDLVSALAGRLGLTHDTFAMTAWEVADGALRESGYPSADALVASGGHDCAGSFDRHHFLDGFPQAGGRFRFAPDWSAQGTAMAPPEAEEPGERGEGAPPGLPDHRPLIEAADSEHPFRLVTAPARHFLNSTFSETETSRRLEGRPTVLVHPDDCTTAGLGGEGTAVRIGNRRGAVVVSLRPFSGLPRGVVVVESLWPAADFAEGPGINALVGADPVPPAGGAAFHDTAVWIRSA